MTDRVNYEHDGGIATITLDDGKANALSPAMQAEIHAAFDRAEADGGAVILTGRDGRFSAGFDLEVMGRMNADTVAMLIGGAELYQRVLLHPAPVVIACNGHALAMGSFLLLAPDYRIGVDGPCKIGPNEVAIGMTLPAFAIEICRERLTPRWLARTAGTAESCDGTKAVAAGFLDEVTSASELMNRARAVAERFNQLDMKAYRESNQLLYGEHATRVVAAAHEQFGSMLD